MMSGEGGLSGGQSSAPSAGQGVASLGLGSQESSWIGLLSRPAVSLLHRIYPGRLRAAAAPDRAESWFSGSPEASALLSQLEELGPPLALLRCEPGKAGGLLDPGPADDLPWIAVTPLQELGLQSAADVDLGVYRHARLGQLSSIRAALGQVLLGSQNARGAALKAWASEAGGSPPVGSGWWGSLRGAEGAPEGGSRGAGPLCPPHPAARAETAGTAPSGSAGPEPSGARREVDRRSEGAAPDPVRGDEAPPTPDREERVHGRRPSEGDSMEEQEEPRCQNKAIAFIMGCPCSDDSSQSDLSDGDDDGDGDDDDGFDSEGSSDLCGSSDGEPDPEAERLWSALSRSADPYNPRNFSARLHTSSSAEPRDVPAASPLSSAQSSPASSPPGGASSCVPAARQDSWDDSASASEADEAESLLLWSSFGGSSDPYCPFNFQAPLRTPAPPAAPLRAAVRPERSSSPSSRLLPAAAPQYRKEEAEERLDSGFSEPCASSSQKSKTIKKVRFSERVEEFFASCGEEEEEQEDRRGPWEQLARDRCRFLRRCLEVERSIAFCLQPQHRRRVYRRLTNHSAAGAGPLEL